MSYYPQALPRANKSKGFTLIEVLVVMAISTVIFAAVFMVWNTGEYSNSIGSANLDLYHEIRLALDWMIRDFRQTATQQINVIHPADIGILKPFGDGSVDVFSDPQFDLCIGYDIGTQNRLWGDLVSYTIVPDPLDPPRQMIIRTNLSKIPPQQLRFRHITGLVFTKLGSRQLRIDISGQKIAKRGVTGPTLRNLALSEEVRIRNE